MKKVYTLKEIVEVAKEKSPFYQALYANLPAEWTLKDLPLIDQKFFWQANSLQNNQLLTGPMENGIVFKSGGTTGNPKFSVFLHNEWESFCRYFGEGLTLGGLKAGSRVVNLFYAGDLYASFLFIMKSMELAPDKVLHLPVSGSAPFESTLKNIEDFSANVIACVPTTIITFAEELEKKGLVLNGVTSILFGGESMYADQRIALKAVFPNAKVQSIGCASVDGGLLGWVDASCQENEHRVFSESTIVELFDDHDQVIEDVGVPGRVILTNLTRTLMPIIRYPAGDQAMWTEPKGTASRKFKLLGRSEEGARVGPVTLYYEDLWELLQKNFSAQLGLVQMQLVIEHKNKLDKLLLRLAVHDPLRVSSQVKESVLSAIMKARPLMQELSNNGKIHKPEIEFLHLSELEKNSRTGKLKRILDLRHI